MERKKEKDLLNEVVRGIKMSTRRVGKIYRQPGKEEHHEKMGKK